MPVHNWKLVDAGIFHDFHQRWIITICNALNANLLPNDFYAMAEQVAEGAIPDVVTLEKMSQASDATPRVDFAGNPISSEIGLAVLDAPPQTRYNHEVDFDLYAFAILNYTSQKLLGTGGSTSAPLFGGIALESGDPNSLLQPA